jgi:hypothetical protein
MKGNKHVLQHLLLPKEIINYILLFDDYIFVDGELIKINKISKKLPIYNLLFDLFNNLEWINYCENWTILRINKYLVSQDLRKFIRIKIYINPLKQNEVFYLYNTHEYIRY